MQGKALRLAWIIALLGTPATPLRAEPGDMLTSFAGTVYGYALNPRNAELYASTDTAVLVIDTRTLTQIRSLRVDVAPRGLAVSPDGSRLYVATSGVARLAVVDLTSYTPLPPLPLPFVPNDVEAGLDGRLYVTPGSTGSYRGIAQIDSASGALQREFQDGFFAYYGALLEISPDRTQLYAANRSLSPGTLARFDVSTEVPVKTYQNPHGSLGSNGQDLWLTPDGEYVYYAVGSGNGPNYTIARIRTFDMLAQGYLATGPYPRHITTSPDGRFAYAVHTSGHIDVWNTETRTQLGEYLTSGEAGKLIVDRSGDHLFASFPGSLRVYEAEGSEPVLDEDADGTDDRVDNCPGLPNPDQADRDADELGDPCDPYPDEANHDLAMCRVALDVALVDLEACRVDLGSCSADLAICRASIPGDADADGEFDPTDACPDTGPGASVDEAGCSAAQFCARHADRRTCARADWKNDEPLEVMPGDCGFQGRGPAGAPGMCTAR